MKSSNRITAESETFTSKELCARYRCAQVTLRRKEEREGYPHGEKYGRNIVYLKTAVHAWERIHMPGLQLTPPVDDDDAEWSLRHRRHVLERDERAAKNREVNNKPQSHQKGERRRGAELSVR